MQEKPPFSSYFDFFPYVWEGDTPSHTHPLRTFILPSGTPLTVAFGHAITAQGGAYFSPFSKAWMNLGQSRSWTKASAILHYQLNSDKNAILVMYVQKLEHSIFIFVQF